jgi:hypothetical protein
MAELMGDLQWCMRFWRRKERARVRRPYLRRACGTLTSS